MATRKILFAVDTQKMDPSVKWNSCICQNLSPTFRFIADQNVELSSGLLVVKESSHIRHGNACVFYFQQFKHHCNYNDVIFG